MSTSRSTTSQATGASSTSNSSGNLCIAKPVDGSRLNTSQKPASASLIHVIIPVMKRDNSEFTDIQNFAAEIPLPQCKRTSTFRLLIVSRSSSRYR